MNNDPHWKPTKARPHRLMIHSVDNGFCKVNYTMRNGKNTLYYCLMEGSYGEFKVVTCYRCCKLFEPSYPVKTTLPLAELFELPIGDSAIEIAVRKHIQEN
jgi:hypothetical protein